MAHAHTPVWWYNRAPLIVRKAGTVAVHRGVLRIYTDQGTAGLIIRLVLQKVSTS